MGLIFFVSLFYAKHMRKNFIFLDHRKSFVFWSRNISIWIFRDLENSKYWFVFPAKEMQLLASLAKISTFFSSKHFFPHFSSLPLLEWHWNGLPSGRGILEVLLIEELVRPQQEGTQEGNSFKNTHVELWIENVLLWDKSFISNISFIPINPLFR